MPRSEFYKTYLYILFVDFYYINLFVAIFVSLRLVYRVCEILICWEISFLAPIKHR